MTPASCAKLRKTKNKKGIYILEGAKEKETMIISVGLVSKFFKYIVKDVAFAVKH